MSVIERVPCVLFRYRYGLLYFVSVNTLFSNVAAIDLFISERVIFL